MTRRQRAQATEQDKAARNFATRIMMLVGFSLGAFAVAHGASVLDVVVFVLFGVGWAFGELAYSAWREVRSEMRTARR